MPDPRRPTWARPLSRRHLRRQLRRLWRQGGSHGHRARGLAAAGTWISNPVTSLPLYWFNYQVGCLLLGSGPAFPSLQQVQEGVLWDLGLAFSSRLMLGSTVVGLVSALTLGGGFWWWGRLRLSPGRRPRH